MGYGAGRQAGYGHGAGGEAGRQAGREAGREVGFGAQRRRLPAAWLLLATLTLLAACSPRVQPPPGPPGAGPATPGGTPGAPTAGSGGTCVCDDHVPWSGSWRFSGQPAVTLPGAALPFTGADDEKIDLQVLDCGRTLRVTSGGDSRLFTREGDGYAKDFGDVMHMSMHADAPDHVLGSMVVPTKSGPAQRAFSLSYVPASADDWGRADTCSCALARERLADAHKVRDAFADTRLLHQATDHALPAKDRSLGWPSNPLGNPGAARTYDELVKIRLGYLDPVTGERHYKVEASTDPDSGAIALDGESYRRGRYPRAYYEALMKHEEVHQRDHQEHPDFDHWINDPVNLRDSELRAYAVTIQVLQDYLDKECRP